MSSQLSEKDKEDRKKIFSEAQEKLHNTALTNSITYDKSILSLSSIFLGGSVTAIPNLIPFEYAWYQWVMFASWISFIISIISVIVSYIFASRSIHKRGNELWDFVVGKINSVEKNKFDTMVTWCNYVSGLCFILGIIFLSLFFYLNLNGGHFLKALLVFHNIYSIY